MARKVGRAALLLAVLQIHLVFGLLLVGLSFVVGASGLLVFMELPGAFVDYATSNSGQNTLWPALFHVVGLLGTAALIRAIRTGDPSSRLEMMFPALAALLVFPFGTVLVAMAWRVSDQDGWDESVGEASGMGLRVHGLVGFYWGIVTLFSILFTGAAYVAWLTGGALYFLPLIAGALFMQWAGFRVLQQFQVRTKTSTFGSPLPDLPELQA